MKFLFKNYKWNQLNIMDTTSIIIYFYSKYSKSCVSLMEQMNTKISYRKVCVDHPKIRNIILSETEKYCIRTVPCFLVFYANGIVNKYEGDKAFEWISDILQKIDNLHRTNHFVSKNIHTEIPKETPILFPLQEIQKEESPKEEESMSRKIDTTPLIDPQLRSEMDHHRMDSNHNDKKIMEKKSENSILNIAQQLQSQREQDVEPK